MKTITSLRWGSSTSIFRAILFVLLCLLEGRMVQLPAQQHTSTFDPELYKALEYRMVGPTRGGRVTAVTGIPDQPFTFFMGGTGGGVFKTTNAGATWVNISDGFFQVGSIGAIAVALSDPNVIYVGTGSAAPRGNISVGNGVCRSRDGGQTWTDVGLPQAGQIGQIRIHPKNPDLVYVAALGHIFGPNPDRGVYRSKDGGNSWEKVLFVSERTGAVDLDMDATNSRILYASMWRAERKPWSIISGGMEGGVYKSTDGGDTWTQLTNGLPKGLIGRTGVAVSPANPNRVWVLAEAAEGEGLYSSDDGGKTFRPINLEQKMLMARPWYYTRVFADPLDENTVYINNESFWKSVDGGRTFTNIRTPHGDNHGLWLNPRDPRIMVESNDGGANVSLDGGKTWSTQLNQPTAELYFVVVDNQFPYRLYGPQQDNTTISVPSRVTDDLTPYQDWFSVGGCETGPVSLNPDKSDIVYAGCYGGRLTRFERKTGEVRQIADWPHIHHGQAASELKYRFQWNAPVLLSRHDPTVLYHASQYIHRTTNDGQSWEVISPDLTRNDKTKQGHGGEPITWDMTGVEVFPTIFALAEAPNDPNILWAGTNDGLVHISRDKGKTWTNVTPPQLPDPTAINRIEVSTHAPGRVFIAAYRYQMDDFRPYILRTEDYGKTWRLLTDGTNGIPADHPVRVVREDPERKGLLYAGTEFGMYVSFDDGAHWQSLQLNLPHTPIMDLIVHESDLVVATEGRSFWIMDDLTPLRQLNDGIVRSDNYLFKPRAAYRMRLAGRGSGGLVQNPPNGAMIFYNFKERPAGEVKLEILDSAGKVIRTFASEETRGEGPYVAKSAGMNRLVWDLRYPGPDLLPDARRGPDRDIIWGDTNGPFAVPGNYQVRLTVGNWSQTQTFSVLKDPRLTTTSAEFQEQFDFLIQVRDEITKAQNGIRRIRAVRTQVSEIAGRLPDGNLSVQAKPLAGSISTKMTEVEKKLMELRRGDVAKLRPELSSQLAWLTTTVGSADARPTSPAYERFKFLKSELSGCLSQIQATIDTDVAAFNKMLSQGGIPPVIVPLK